MTTFILRVLIFTALQCITAMTTDASITDLAIHQYKELCPLTKTCYSNGTTDVSQLEKYWVNKELCCASCRCDEDCGQECCPDQRNISFKLPDNNYVDVECVSVGMIAGEEVDSFYMIKRCPPSYIDNKTVVGCLKQYSDFRYGDDVANLPPVSSNLSYNLYQNRLCALCHGESIEDLIPWDIKFSCSRNPPFIPGSFKEMLDMVDLESIPCNLVFSKPISSIEHRECGMLVDTCNATGQWDVFDPVTAAACHSYTSIYAGRYKNVHCALCNGHNYTAITSFCEYISPNLQSFSFLALLDFNQLTKRPQDVDECPPQQIFDPLKGDCKTLLCSHGFTLVDNKCTSLFKSITSLESEILYATSLVLVPTDTNASINIELLKTSTLTHIQTKGFVFGLRTQICAINSFIRLKRTIHKQIIEMHLQNRGMILSDIDFIALDIQIGIEILGNDSIAVQFIESILNDFKNSHFRVIHLSEHTSTIEDTSLKFNMAPSERTSLELDMLNNLPVARFSLLSLDLGFDVAGYGVIPFVGLLPVGEVFSVCTASYFADFDTYCPKLIINRYTYDMYLKNTSSDHLNASDPAFSVTLDEDSLTLDWNNVQVCHEDYLEKVSMVLNKDQDSEKVSELPLVIITIVCLSVSLLALVITLTVYSYYPKLRTLPGLNNMALVISLMLFYMFSLINASTNITITWLCRVVGIALHFSLLSSFGWMFICTFHMARVFATISQTPQQSNIHRTFARYIVFVVSVSAAIIISTIIVSYLQNDGTSFGYADSPCYVKTSTLLYNVAIPVGCTILINLVMFLSVIVIIGRLPNVRKNSKNERHNLTIFAKLSTLTGLTWIFAFVYQITNVVPFAYVFVLLNASQGVFIMVSFIINKRVYDLIRKGKHVSSYYSSGSRVSRLSTHGYSLKIDSKKDAPDKEITSTGETLKDSD